MSVRDVVCFVLCVAIGGTVAQDQDKPLDRHLSTYDCHVTDLPTGWRTGTSPGNIEHNNVSFGESGRSSIELNFRNGGPDAIEKLALVVEYFGVDGGLVDRVPVVGGVIPGIPDTPPSVLSPAQAWRRALTTGDVARMVTVKDGVRTGHCPVRARVTFAAVQFSDAKVKVFSSSGWQLAPVPTVVPRLPENIPDLPVPTPVPLIAKLRVSASGRVLDVLNEEADPRLVNWVRDRMKDWKFHPALVNGSPTDSEFMVLFRIHAKGMLRFPETQPILQPITLVQFFWSHDLFPDTAGRDRWTVMYGPLNEDTVVEYPFSEWLPSGAQTN